MTPEMISKARRNTEKSVFENVEFRLGEIEHMPVNGRCDYFKLCLTYRQINHKYLKKHIGI